MTSDVAVHVEQAGKRYTKYVDQPLLINALRLRHRTRQSDLWAVRGLSFDVGRGERVGVIGRNGSGKSTMLRMLAGVTAPSEGRVVVRGRVAPLISVGVGFHPELTGRENVYVNGSILGLTRREIDARFDSILDFSEIEDFIDTPVKFYSSGMFVRLGFSVAIHSDPSVLLVDEVLAVGDFKFQMKCFDRMMEIRSAGTTILVVSHNITAVRVMCDRAIVLHGGTSRFDGPVADAVDVYHQIMDEHRELDDRLEEDFEPGTAVIESVVVNRDDGARTANIGTGDPVRVAVVVQAERDLDDPMIGLLVASTDGRAVYTDQSRAVHPGVIRRGEKRTFHIRFRPNLATGSYVVRASLVSRDLARVYARSKAANFYVTGRPMVTGVADLNAEFDLAAVE